MDTDPNLVCVVCRTEVGPEAGVCPTCGEPRVRICNCGALVDLAHRECPACHRVLLRLISMEERRRRRWRTRFTTAAVAAGVLGIVAFAMWPRVLDSRRAAAFLESGRTALADGLAEQAARDLADYVRLRPGDPEGLHLLAVAHLARGDEALGLHFAEKALEADPRSPGTHLALARHFQATRDLHAALAHARASHEPEAPGLAAAILARLGRTKESAEAFDDAVARAPDDLDLALAASAAHARLGGADWSGATAHRERATLLLDQVVRRAESRLASDAGDASAADAAVRALTAREGVPVERIDTAVRRAAALRLSIDAGTAWAEVLARAGRSAEVPAALGPGTDPSLSPALRLRRARALAAAAGFDAADRDLRAALDRHPSDAAAATARARMLLDAGRPGDALTAVGAARSAGSAGSADLLEVAGDAALASGDPALAEKHFVAWREAAPRDPQPLRRLLALRMPGILADRRAALEVDERARTATARLEDLAALDVDDRDYLYWRAQWDDTLGRRDDARRLVARLLVLYPEDAAARTLRIRRAFSAEGADPPEQIAAEFESGADPTPGDVRTFTECALDADRLGLVLDVGGRAIERSGAAPGRIDPGLVDVVARALLALRRPAAAAALIERTLPDTSRGAVTATYGAALALSARSADAIALVPGDAPVRHRLAVARALACAGRIDDARRLADEAALRARGDAAALEAVGSTYDDLGIADAARAAWSAAEDAAAPSDAQMRARATAAMLLRPTSARGPGGEGGPGGDHAAAAQRLAALTLGSRRAPESLALRGAFAFANGEDALAIDDLRNAIEGLDDRPDLRLALARAEARFGEPDAAAHGLRRLLRRDPGHPAARLALADVLVESAARALATARLVDALDRLDELDSLSASAPAAASPLDAIPRPLTDATAEACRARQAPDPGAAGHELLLALDAAARGDAELADALATRITDARPDAPGGPLVRSVVRFRAGRRDDGVADAALALDRGADPSEVAFVLGAAAPPASLPDDAVEGLRAAAGRAPERRESEDRTADAGHGRLRAALCVCLRARGDRDEALAAFESLLASSPARSAALGLHAWGRDLAAAGRAGAARTALARALLVDPANEEAGRTRDALSRLR